MKLVESLGAEVRAVGADCVEAEVVARQYAGDHGMTVDMVYGVLDEVVRTLNRTELFSHCQVMSVLFAQHMDVWDERKRLEAFRSELVGLREFHFLDKLTAEECRDEPDAFDLCDYAVGALRDGDEQPTCAWAP